MMLQPTPKKNLKVLLRQENHNAIVLLIILNVNAKIS